MSETLFLNNTLVFCLNHLEVAPQLRAFAALLEDELRSWHPGGSPSSTPSLAPTVGTYTLEPKPAYRYTPTYTQLKVISQHSAFLGVYKPYKTVCHIAVVWKYSVGTFPQKTKIWARCDSSGLWFQHILKSWICKAYFNWPFSSRNYDESKIYISWNLFPHTECRSNWRVCRVYWMDGMTDLWFYWCLTEGHNDPGLCRRRQMWSGRDTQEGRPSCQSVRVLLQLASLQLGVSPIGEDVWKGENCVKQLRPEHDERRDWICYRSIGQKHLLFLVQSGSLLTSVFFPGCTTWE